jgi:hypothetical protein
MRAAEQELRFQRPTPHARNTPNEIIAPDLDPRICVDHQPFKRTTTMAIKASFSSGAGLLSVFGDNLDNTITASRDAAKMQIDDRMVNLSPGMAVTVEIKTGSRRILNYLLSPLLRYRQETLRER